MNMSSAIHALAFETVLRSRRLAELGFAEDVACEPYRPGSTPSAGCCTVAAMLVRHRMGGEFVSTTISGLSHWFNRVRVHEVWFDADITGDQFGFAPVRVALPNELHTNTRARSEFDINAETWRRYAVFAARCGVPSTAAS